MKNTWCLAYLRPSLLGLSISGLASVSLLAAAPRIACAQNAGNIDPTQTTDWAPGAIDYAQKMRMFKDPVQGSQATPQSIKARGGCRSQRQRRDVSTRRRHDHPKQCVLREPRDQWAYLFYLPSATEWLDH